jgi:hypothetical protein
MLVKTKIFAPNWPTIMIGLGSGFSWSLRLYCLNIQVLARTIKLFFVEQLEKYIAKQTQHNKR